MHVLAGVLEGVLELGLGGKLDLDSLVLGAQLVGALVDDVGVVGDSTAVPCQDLVGSVSHGCSTRRRGK